MGTDFDSAAARVRAGQVKAADAAADLVSRLTEEEKLWLLDGDQAFWPGIYRMAVKGYNRVPVVAGAVPRAGIPGVRFTDGPRGVVMGESTCFPVAMSRGASWDPALEENIGRAMGAEARAQGANLFAGVCVNLLRHPAWGRAQETYGEDPVHIGVMGAAATRGVRQHVMACVKHYALNSIENARFAVDVTVDEEALHQVYLPHFRAVIDAGADAVMSAYNSVNGEWAGQNRALLTGILREEWGFTGFVMTDFVWGLRDPVGSLAAGQDLEMPFRQQRARHLPAALRSGRVSMTDVETAGTRIVAAQLAYRARPPQPLAADVVACQKHRALARRAAACGMVLLRNEPVGGRPVLPLHAADVRSIAVVGRLADKPNIGDKGSSAVRPPATVSALAGIRTAFGPARVTYHDGADRSAAARVARDADVAVVVAGYTAKDEGEAMVGLDAAVISATGSPPLNFLPLARVWAGLMAIAASRRILPGGDRRSLRLHAQDEDLIQVVADANPRTVVVVITGSAVVMEAWRERVPAILMAWYPGMEGGSALADVLTGAAEPGGRMPVATPTDPAHLPVFDPGARHITYDRWWGQRKLDRDGHQAAYPLGFGLGYTTFALTGLEVAGAEPLAVDGSGGVSVSVTVTNTGAREGSTVVQLYAVSGDPGAHDQPGRQLLGFTRVQVPAGGSTRAQVCGSLRPLARHNPATRTWSLVPGSYRLEAAQHSGDPQAATADLPPLTSG
ncbi:MAG: beta-glucosidase family protein [Micromonosporaceae bacterium]